MKQMAKKAVTPGPRDERGVLQARILNSARQEFATHGWAGTTIRAVARAADVDPALVYHYFGSKERLLDAATEPPAKWLETVAATWATPRAELGTQLVRAVLGGPPGCRRGLRAAARRRARGDRHGRQSGGRAAVFGAVAADDDGLRCRRPPAASRDGCTQGR